MSNGCNWIDVILHTKDFLTCFISNNPDLIYFLLCAIVFCETGLVATPFLPGDSLLFTAGLLAKTHEGVLNVYLLAALLFLSAILGDNVNYLVGKKIGIRIFNIKFLSRIVKREYLEKTEKFFDKHGGKTIILARFVPIVRTFAPFSAGMGNMPYTKYISYCIGGGLLWVNSILFAGYFLGTNEWVNKNFEKVVLGIVFLSLLPVIIGFLKEKFSSKEKNNS
ncbi:MAG: VTT domain-containing protein [Bacteroidota bacterium]